MNFLMSNIQYIHVMAMTILLSGMAISIRRLKTKEVRWFFLMLPCLLAYILRVMFGSNAPVAVVFFEGLFFFTPVVFMLAFQSIFDDEFEIGKLEWAVIGALLVHLCVTLAWRMLEYELSDLVLLVVFNAIFGLVAFCVLWTYWRTIKTWSNDLVEPRRKLRMFFVVLLGPLIFIGIVFYYITYADAPLTEYAHLFVSSAIIFCGVYLLVAFGDINLLHLPIEALYSKDKESTERGVGHADHGYQREIDALQTIMEVERRYLECNLNMAKLAEYAEMPEYKLRVAINQVLGHKNFNAYLSTYRIDAAKAMLSDPNNDESITNIAIECGYSNQSTFNKAFRQAMSFTPSEFRELAIK